MVRLEVLLEHKGFCMRVVTARGLKKLLLRKSSTLLLLACLPALRRGLVIATIQGDDFRNAPLKDVITAVKSARRPLTLESQARPPTYLLTAF